MKLEKYEILETKRLLLRKIRKTDAEHFFRLAGNANVAKYMLWQPHHSIKDTKESIEKIVQRYEQVACYCWGIALCSDDSLIGRIDLLRFDEIENSCSFAYMINDSFWGQGFGTEALSAVLDYAFEKLQMQIVRADHICENVASGAVMKKVGMQYTKTIVGKYEKNGQTYDAKEYEITYHDWKKDRENLLC